MAALFLASSLFPLVGSFLSIFMPIPIMFFYERLGRSLGLMVVVLALLVAWVISAAVNLPLNTITIIQFALMGVLMAEAITRGVSVLKSVLAPSLLLFGITVALISFQALTNHTSPSVVLHQYFSYTLKDTLGMYHLLGIPGEQVQKMEESAGHVIAVFTRIAPALFLGLTALIIWINLLICRKVFPRWGLGFGNFGDLTRWRSPEPLVWVLIGCGCGMLVPLEVVRTVALNGILIMLLVYFFQGVAIVACFFKTYRMPRIIRIAGYMLIATQQFVLILVVGLGLFDLWFNFRKLILGRSKNAGSLEDGGSV